MNYYLLRNGLNVILTLIPLLLRVAFLTLVERKVLAFSQIRLGPNKTLMGGVVQPFRDAIKLLTKSIIFISSSNKFLFFLSPILILILSIVVWILMPHYSSIVIWRLSFLALVAILRCGVYPILWRGWRSNRRYAYYGRIRGVAQRISYEISFSILVMSVNVIFSSLRIDSVNSYINYRGVGFSFLPLFLLLGAAFIAETNRTPFDFAEGESELVSGFNIEFGSVGFVIIFLAEYARILIVSLILSFLLFNKVIFSLRITMSTIIISWLWIQIRSSLPRFRYDFLIDIAWKSYLPVSLMILIVSFSSLLYIF